MPLSVCHSLLPLSLHHYSMFQMDERMNEQLDWWMDGQDFEGKKSSHSWGLIYCMLICCEAAHVKTFPVIKLGTEPIKARNKPKTEYCDNTVQVKVNKTSGFFHFFLFNEVNISSSLEDHLADFESSLPFLTIIGMCPNWSMLNIYNMKPCIVKVTAMDYWDVTWRNYDCN